jgi:hypothetical protein
VGQRLSALGSWICAAFSSSLSACGVLVFIGIAWRERRDRDAVRGVWRCRWRPADAPLEID